MPSQSNRRENSGVLEDIRFMSDQIMYDTLSEGKKNNHNRTTSSSIRTALREYVCKNSESTKNDVDIWALARKTCEICACSCL